MPFLGNPIPVAVQLWDTDNVQYVLATIRNAIGTIVTTLPVPNVASGLYSAIGPAMPDTPFVTVTFQVFTDPGMTIVSPNHSDTMDIFELEFNGGAEANTYVINTAKARFVQSTVPCEYIEQTGGEC